MMEYITTFVDVVVLKFIVCKMNTFKEHVCYWGNISQREHSKLLECTDITVADDVDAAP